MADGVQPVLLVFYMAISIADILTTERVIRNGGREANPVMRWLMEHLGRGVIVIKGGQEAGVPNRYLQPPTEEALQCQTR